MTSAIPRNPTASRLAVSTRPVSPLYRWHIGTAEDATVHDLSITICLASRGTVEHTYLPDSSCATSTTSLRAVGRRDLSTTLARILEPSLAESSCVKRLGTTGRWVKPRQKTIVPRCIGMLLRARLTSAGQTKPTFSVEPCDATRARATMRSLPTLRSKDAEHRCVTRDEQPPNMHAKYSLQKEAAAGSRPAERSNGLRCNSQMDRNVACAADVWMGNAMPNCSRRPHGGNRSVAPAPEREQEAYWRPVACPAAVENHRPAVYFGPLPLRNSPQNREKLPR